MLVQSNPQLHEHKVTKFIFANFKHPTCVCFYLDFFVSMSRKITPLSTLLTNFSWIWCALSSLMDSAWLAIASCMVLMHGSVVLSRLQGMMGGYGPMMPMQGPHEGMVGMGSMPLHHMGVPALHHHLQPGMPGFPGMPYPGKDTPYHFPPSHAHAVASCLPLTRWRGYLYHRLRY